MEYRMLGCLEAESATGERLNLGGPSEQKLLAVLLDAKGMVPVTGLVDALWDEDPPATAVKQVQNLVSRLRRLLAQGDEPDPILTRPGGYQFRPEGHTLDTRQFEAKVAEAEAAAVAGEMTKSAVLLQAALELWRGPSLSGLSGKIIEAAASAWNERRCGVQERYFDVRLALGEHRQIIGDLTALVSAHPMRERPVALLMLALYKCGRQAEALALYRDTRSLLDRELGLEPGPELQRLHQQMLAGGPLNDGQDPEPSSAKGIGQVVVPRELPGGLRHFVGRARELGVLTELSRQLSQAIPGSAVISVIAGTAGIGKTSLALHFAHRVADQFGDGQLYVNLRGFDPSGAPMTSAEAVRGLLDALGVSPERIPAQPEAQSGLYRSLLASKQTLIVLDNARDEQQVRPLLPASSASLVIVTSRNQLAGLAATDGARLLSLDVLPRDEAAQLLPARIGANRTATEADAVDEIISFCACLPLGLAVAAARAAARPDFPLAVLAAELRDASCRLDVLDVGDSTASVRVVFSWSYEHLSPAAARMFGLLGLHPGPDIGIRAAASLAAVDEPAARRVLSELTRDCLITEYAPGRYAFHDLLRAYAADKARECDPDCDAAIGRVLDHYLHSASHAATLLQPSREPAVLGPPSTGIQPELPADHREALAWFGAEHQSLFAAVTLGVETGADRHAFQLSWAMSTYLYMRGYLHEGVTVMGVALAAASRLGDELAQARSLRGLGSAYARTGDFAQARVHLKRCLGLYRRLGDRLGEAWTHRSLGGLASVQGRQADAIGHAEQALNLYRVIGDEVSQAETLNNIGFCHAQLGDYERARASCEQALGLIAKMDSYTFEYNVWDTLGYIELQLGNFAQAAAHFEFALDLCRDHGHRYDEVPILINIGDARRATGRLPEARQVWQQALAIYEEIEHPDVDKVRAKLAGLEQPEENSAYQRSETSLSLLSRPGPE